MPIKPMKPSNDPVVIHYTNLLKKLGQGGSWTDNLLAGAVAGLKAGLNPLGAAADIAKALGNFGGLSDDDAENVHRIIKSGKQNNVDKMSIEMERDQWLGLKGKLDAGEADAEVAFGTGGSTGYRIDVKYK